MADPAMTTPNNHGPIPPLPKPPGRDFLPPPKPMPLDRDFPTPKPIRHVSFSESPPKYAKPAKKRQRCFRSCCCCCLWTFFALLCIVLMLVLIGALLIACFQSKLPVIRIEQLRIPRFDVSISPDRQSFLTADVGLYIEAWNKNRRIGLSYGPLTLEVSSETVNLGQTGVAGFFQEPKNITVMKVHTGVIKSLVDNGDGARLQSKFIQKVMVVDVALTGTLKLVEGRFKTSRVPVSVQCRNVELSKVASGIEPQCYIKIFSLRDIF